MTRTVRVTVTIAIALAGCGPHGQHVQLPALPLDNQPDQRVALFSQYRPVEATIVSTCSGACSVEHESIRLANGIEIRHPTDLIPIVGESSRTARAARAGERDRSVFDGLGAGAAIGVLGGIVAINRSERVGGGLLLAGLACMIAMGVFHYEATEDDAEAFRVYQRELGQRLNVCASGLSVVPCESPPPPQPIR